MHSFTLSFFTEMHSPAWFNNKHTADKKTAEHLMFSGYLVDYFSFMDASI